MKHVKETTKEILKKNVENPFKKNYEIMREIIMKPVKL